MHSSTLWNSSKSAEILQRLDISFSAIMLTEATFQSRYYFLLILYNTVFLISIFVLSPQVCPVPLGIKNLVSKQLLPFARKPRMSPSYRLLLLPSRMQTQILRAYLWSLHGILLLFTTRSCHEQTVPVYPRWIVSRTTYSRWSPFHQSI